MLPETPQMKAPQANGAGLAAASLLGTPNTEQRVSALRIRGKMRPEVAAARSPGSNSTNKPGRPPASPAGLHKTVRHSIGKAGKAGGVGRKGAGRGGGAAL